MACAIARATLPVFDAHCAVRNGSGPRDTPGLSSRISWSASATVYDVRLAAGASVAAGRVEPSSSSRGLSVATSATNGRGEAEAASTEYVPAADFYKVEGIVRPWRLPHVASALISAGIRGVTVADVRGFGSQGVSRERHGGSEFSEDSFVTKVKLEVVVSKDQVEVVVDTIIEHARTGEIGDGKIFISPVADVIRVRTGERGLLAERMIGGRSERVSSKVN